MKVKILPITNSEYECLSTIEQSKLEGAAKVLKAVDATVFGISCLLNNQGIKFKDVCKYTILVYRGKLGCTHYLESEKLYNMLNF